VVVADLAKLSVGREDYYVREVAHNREEYLSGHGESPGRWYGAGATALGQEGTATTEGFKRVFEGRHPDTGELLGRAHGNRAVPGWDLVLRPIKDVGVLYALGDERVNRAVMRAHYEGVAEAVAYLDAHVGTRRGHGGHQKVSGRGLVVVGFDHRTSREGDPLPHTHLIIANRTQGPDGRWTTLDGRDLYAHRRAADALYRAAYQRSLTRSLGIAWGEADRWGNRPIVGMPAEVVRAFSKRNQQISEHLALLEEQGRQRTPALVRFAVHATRHAKCHEAPETLYERWRAEALTRGIDPDGLVRQVSGRAREQDRGVSNLAVKRAFNRLAGPEGLTAGASTFARQDVVVALGGELAGAGPAELGALTEQFLAERAVAVIDDRAEASTERRWSVPDLLSVERALVAAAEARQSDHAGVVAAELVRATLAAHPTIGDDQAGMVRDLCQRGDGVSVVEGRAGTGKTFALGVARHAWQVGGYRVLGTAPTGIATMSLEAEGFEETATCDRLLAELDRHGAREVLGDRGVLVVDEAGMLGSRKLARLLRDAGPGQTSEAIRSRISGRRPTLGTVHDALWQLEQAGLAARQEVGNGEPPRWSPTDPPRDDTLDDLKLCGPHDLRHTFSTWLEDAGIPARVIDELMGHAGGRPGGGGHDERGSVVGLRYRWTTPEMEARVVAAIEQRLAVSLAAAARVNQ
jgi:conjugative relaxase-like TrwC/TraI family protein